MTMKLGVLNAAAIAALISFGTPAGAATYVFSGNSAHDGPVQAQANFTLNSGSITITLTDLLANPTSAGQLVSGLIFNESGANGSGNLTTVNSALVTTINTSTNAYTAGVNDVLTRWKATETGTAIKLTTLSGGNPDRLIIGPDNANSLTGGGLYTNANASIGGDNPNILGSATFTITIPGVTSLSTLSNVYFMFGTADDPYDLHIGTCINCNTAVTETPIPAALFLFGSVLAGATGVGRRRKKQANRAIAA